MPSVTKVSLSKTAFATKKRVLIRSRSECLPFILDAFELRKAIV